ncbi:DegT/DnrJ/EryC1/StrS family aminotransferase [Actinomadura sp. 1N219]|uniref:DegT/DnrJ/EryC1/StrS family aminotransferase n=1 Tax=Actinomadura sp. 1N219 TaxID=3375152 RepID=UPI0037996A87
MLELRERRWPAAPTAEERELLAETAGSRSWTDGVWTEEVERRMAELTGAPHAVAFNSCTSALHAALYAMGAERGAPVTIPAFTFAGTVTGARHIGAALRFADVAPDTLTLDPAAADGGLTIAVDLHGVPHGLPRDAVLTDACQSLGTRIGGRHVGAIGTHAWSFSASKMVTAPDGGAVTTSDPALADHMRELRDYGVPAGRSRSNAGVVWPGGHNWRPSELSMVMVGHRLGRLGHWTARSREVTGRLHAALDRAGLWRQHVPAGAEPGWHKVRFGAPDWNPRAAGRMERALAEAGVPTHRWGAVPVHRHPAFRPDGQPPRPVAERAAAGTLCLGTEACPPMTWTDDEVDQVCVLLETIREG